MYIFKNNNPNGLLVGDCVIRAISEVMDEAWSTVYLGLVVQGYMMCDMPSSNSVWGAYLHNRGFERKVIPDTCPDCYTVKDFCKDHKRGKYILATGSHVVAAKDGDYIDTWDSGDEIPIYYWRKI